MEKGLGRFILGNTFHFDDYRGKRGLNLRNPLHLDLPAPEPAGAQFVFVGVFGKGLSFQFVEPSSTGRKSLDLTFDGSVLQAKPSYVPLEDHALPEGFLDRRVAFIAKLPRRRLQHNSPRRQKFTHTHLQRCERLHPSFHDIQITHANRVIRFYKC